jgi:hypothetical protein
MIFARFATDQAAPLATSSQLDALRHGDSLVAFEVA